MVFFVGNDKRAERAVGNVYWRQAWNRVLTDGGGTTPHRKGKIMDVDLIFKIAAIGILVAVLNQLLVRSGREEQAMMTTLAGLVVVLMILVQEISQLFDLIKTLFDF